MPDDAAIRQELRARTSWSAQNLSNRVSRLVKKTGSRPYALYVLALRNGVKMEKYGVDDDTLLKIARLSSDLTEDSPPRQRSNDKTGQPRSRTASNEASSKPTRRLATVLFTDIVDSTQAASAMGDSKWSALLTSHDEASRKLIRRHGGSYVKSTGDGVLATFDAPADAIRCAKAIAEGVQELGISIRAGIHAGEIEFRAKDVAGVGVHVAARIEAAAPPGEVVVSRTVKDLVRGSGIRFRSLGSHKLKGVSEKWELFAANP